MVALSQKKSTHAAPQLGSGGSSPQSSAPASNQAVAEQISAASVPDSGTTCLVGSGDTLWSIAERMLGDGERWREIYRANLLSIGPSPNLIYPGQIFIIPGASTGSAPSAVAKATATTAPTGNTASPVPREGGPTAPAVSESVEASSTSGAPPVCFDEGSQPLSVQPQPAVRPAEAAFQEAKSQGKGDMMALVHSVVEEPGDTIKVFGEVFVEDELRSFVAGMDLANDVAAFSPNPIAQDMVTFVTQPLANLVDIFAGAVRGDNERIQQALQDTVTETVEGVTVGAVTKGLGIKTGDGRVGVLSTSNAAIESVSNNLAVSMVVDDVKELASWVGDKIRKGLFGE